MRRRLTAADIAEAAGDLFILLLKAAAVIAGVVLAANILRSVG